LNNFANSQTAAFYDTNWFTQTMNNFLRSNLQVPGSTSTGGTGGIGYARPLDGNGPTYAGLPLSELQPVSYMDGPMPPGSGGPVFVDPRVAEVMNADPSTGFIARGYGIGGHMAGDLTASGFNYSIAGTIVALQNWVAENTLVGVVGGYGHTRVNQDFAYSTIDSYQVGLYGKQYLGNLYVQGLAAYDHDQYATVRNNPFVAANPTARGGASGDESFASLETGYDFTWNGVRISPFVGLQYITVSQGSMAETGAGAFDLSFAGSTLRSVRSNLGGQLSFDFELGNVRIIPLVYATWWHEYNGDSSVVAASFAGVPGGNFGVQSPRLGTDFVTAGAGAAVRLTDLISLYVNYDLQSTFHYTGQAGGGGLVLHW